MTEMWMYRRMRQNVSGVTDLQEMVSVSVHSHSIYLSACLVCVHPVFIITYKEAFHILWYRTMQKVHCLKYQVQLIVPVGLHHQSNICCKTWHKKPVTQVNIGCHALCWQFYHQWTDGSCCVAPAWCLHTVVLGPVYDSRDIAMKLYLTVLPCHIRRCDTSLPCWSKVGRWGGGDVSRHCFFWVLNLF